MPRRPNFYCDFYCALWDRLRRPGTDHHQAGSRHSSEGGRERALQALGGDLRGGIPGSSGSRGVPSEAQRLFPVGRPGIDGLRVCPTSPIGPIRRGR